MVLRNNSVLQAVAYEDIKEIYMCGLGLFLQSLVFNVCLEWQSFFLKSIYFSSS